MDKHQGQILEYIVRKNGYSITNLARDTNVNRRSIYNWFNQKQLKSDIIFNIGCILRHDFSKEFPELFKSDDFKIIFKSGSMDVINTTDTYKNASTIYKDKYLSLLEKYHELLLNEF